MHRKRPGRYDVGLSQIRRFPSYPIHMNKNNAYTCAEYREEMMLLGLKRRLANHNLTEEERQVILREIEKLEIAMDIN